MRSDHRLVTGAVVVLVVVLGATLSACGARRTTLGAAPYEPSTTASAGRSGLSYPAETLTFRLPKKLTKAEKQATRAYIRFQVAFQHDLRTHKVHKKLLAMAYPSVHALIRQQVGIFRKLGRLPGPTVIRVKQVKVAGNTAGIAVCSTSSDGRLPAAVLMVRDAAHPYRVSVIGVDKKRKTC